MPTLQSLHDIPAELTHDGSIFRQALIRVTDGPGVLATCNYAWLEPGMEMKPHTHPDGTEFYLFLAGIGQMRVGEAEFFVKAEDFVTIPPTFEHALKTTHPTDKLVFISWRTVQSA